MICRLLPVIKDQINNERPVNLYFIAMEGAGSICLGTSAVILGAYPFIVVNLFSLSVVAFILIMRMYRSAEEPSEKPIEVILAW